MVVSDGCFLWSHSAFSNASSILPDCRDVSKVIFAAKHSSLNCILDGLFIFSNNVCAVRNDDVEFVDEILIRKCTIITFDGYLMREIAEKLIEIILRVL